MESSFSSRLVHALHVTVGAIYLLGTVASLVVVTVGIGSGVYGATNYVVGHLLTESEPPIVLPPDHRDALMRGDPEAIELEARWRHEGNEATWFFLPIDEELKLKEKISRAMWDATDTPGDRDRAFRQTVLDPLEWAGVAMVAGPVVYFLVWTLRWLVTGRSSTVLGWFRRSRRVVVG